MFHYREHSIAEDKDYLSSHGVNVRRNQALSNAANSSHS